MVIPDGVGRDTPSVETGKWNRRRFLRLAGGGAVGAGAARVVYELLGYGAFTGTNLTEQRLGPLARRRLGPSPFTLSLADRRLVFDGDTIALEDGEGAPVTSTKLGEPGADAASNHDVDSRYEQSVDGLAADLRAIAAGEHAFEFSGYRAFFDRLRDARVRPFTVAALRGDRFGEPSVESVREFAGADPREPSSFVVGLAEGFRERTHFDVPRYVAGNVQDHVLFDAVSLRPHFHERTTFDAMLDRSSTGMYCWEHTVRSIEAFHAAAPHRQSPPAFGAVVVDMRHNHSYTAIASVVRENGDVRIPMTFLDYSHSTMYDNFHLRWALGDGVDAYGEHHRATDIHYSNVYSRLPSHG